MSCGEMLFHHIHAYCSLQSRRASVTRSILPRYRDTMTVS